MTPYHPPRPRILVAEGWRYGFIQATPSIREVVIRKGKPNESEVQVLDFNVITAVPDENSNIECTVEASIFLHDEEALTKGGSNYRYLQFLRALQIDLVEVPTPTGPQKMLPDPDPLLYTGMPIKVLVKHESWEGRDGTVTVARAKKFDQWDGRSPETGESVEAPTAAGLDNDEDSDRVPF